MYYIKAGSKYIGTDKNNVPIIVGKKRNAHMFVTEARAINFINNLPNILTREKWQVFSTENSKDNLIKEDSQAEIFSENFSIEDFLQKTIKCISNLRQFKTNMKERELQCNMEILDIRHYIRNRENKINCIQMQRLMYYLQDVERKREYYKKSRLAAGKVIENYDRLADKNFADDIQKLFHTKYKPRILTNYEIEKIINTKKADKNAKN